MTDMELSERVCKALGIERLPKVAWDPLPHYPNVLDGDGFLRVVERLKTKGIWFTFSDFPDGYMVELWPAADVAHGTADTLPRALALAVLEWEASRGA